MKKYLIGLLAAVICILPLAQTEAADMAQAKKTTQVKKSSAQRKHTLRKPAAKKKVARKPAARTSKKGARRSSKPDYTTAEIRGLQSKRSAMQKEIK